MGKKGIVRLAGEFIKGGKEALSKMRKADAEALKKAKEAAAKAKETAAKEAAKAAADKKAIKDANKAGKKGKYKLAAGATLVGAGAGYGFAKYAESETAKKAASEKKTPGKTTFTGTAAKSPSAKPYKSEAMNKNYSKNVENSRKVQINQTANEINRAKVTSNAQKVAENRRKVEANKKKVAANKVAVTAAKAKKKK